ncbi:MAG: dehydrogenase [Acidobacteria bacterium]|nr:MAG: dehydrogenase [Acidobacteriota bacterium]REJ99018.1 MAG: dehydrogenase [Acidobacteriota bacterium]REK16261.1 MAG: dehydrogenase [Acidobacteriota bacterium]REK43942.1 MAG: dehydrogenase [Acidobacteriota bacterium]
MARVNNWQLGREMSYWYPEERPNKQFAAVFDINKCIACQTCTLACKTTWTSGKGQEYMLWNNVETKPYGFYPLSWDLKLLEMLDGQEWSEDGGRYEGRTIFESAPAGERVLGWRPEDEDYSYPNVGEDDCAGQVDGGASIQMPHMAWFYYLARICNHCTYPACLSACPRGSIYKRPEDGIVLVDQGRCRGYQECVRGCPYKKVFYNAMTGTSEKCIGCFPKIEQGLQPQCFVNCIGKIRLAGWISKPGEERPDNPIDYLVRIKKIALPLFPQFGLEPNVYYIPPIHVPTSFTRQMFGPGVDAAIEAYKAAGAEGDDDLTGLLGLFGSTEEVLARWKRSGDTITGYNDKGEEAVSVPLREPVSIRPSYDKLYQITRVNCP